MKSERLAYAFGKINDDLIYGAVTVSYTHLRAHET